MATAGLFRAVSASTLAAGMVRLEEDGAAVEAWMPALNAFMDIPALLTAIVLGWAVQQATGFSAWGVVLLA
jgi:hypothetical protein